jgi:hypothetical protein
LGCNPTPIWGGSGGSGGGSGKPSVSPPPTPLLGRLKIGHFLGPKKAILENSRTGMLIELLDPNSNQDSDFSEIKIFLKRKTKIKIKIKNKK